MKCYHKNVGWDNSRTKGFTLIEVIIVLMIVTILSVIAFPSLKSMIYNSKMTTYASKVVTALALARTEAIRRSRPVLFAPRYDEDWNTGFAVCLDNDNDGNCNKDFDDFVLRYWDMDEDVEFEVFPNNPIAFRSNGQLAGSSTTVELQHTDCSNNLRRIVVISLSGSTRVDRAECE